MIISTVQLCADYTTAYTARHTMTYIPTYDGPEVTSKVATLPILLNSAIFSFLVPTMPLPDPLHPSPKKATPLLSTSQPRYHAPAVSPVKLRARLNIPPADPSKGAVDWLSIAVIYWVTPVAEAARGLVLPSAWPYLQTFGGSRESLGYLVAAFTLGRALANIPLGYLSDKFSKSSVLIAAPIFQTVGHLCYAVSPSIPSLILSRTLVGFSSSTVCVCRAYFANAIPQDKRTTHYAWLSATQFIGFVVLPGVGGLLASLPEFNIIGIPLLYVNHVV